MSVIEDRARPLQGSPPPSPSSDSPPAESRGVEFQAQPTVMDESREEEDEEVQRAEITGMLRDEN